MKTYVKNNGLSAIVVVGQHPTKDWVFVMPQPSLKFIPEERVWDVMDHAICIPFEHLLQYYTEVV